MLVRIALVASADLLARIGAGFKNMVSALMTRLNGFNDTVLAIHQSGSKRLLNQPGLTLKWKWAAEMQADIGRGK